MKTAKTISDLLVTLHLHTKKQKSGTVLHCMLVILGNKEHVLRPDLVFVKKDRTDIIRSDAIYGSPDLVIEVWIPNMTNFHKLTVSEKKIYEEYGVQEFWIADPYEQNILRFLLSGGVYREVEKSELFPNLEITF
ncbi:MULTISPECIES: Uma2 family endonuclease [Brevibacillus]|uniref:Uma2 family endonuclease n=1 Tax=Brevibacillus TaxID=55080 RepID=UPI0017615966|nr:MULTISPECIES: Uma2 family endonuclease [Brevibacillus]MDR9507577.1 Uma2 family endonuclease [Brevibacillus agri]WNF05531.1 Uma2 family endonuclease [Brevibacillus borstelensis]HAJ4019657.1 hypothetical protein [Escherichia coli]